ncbi:MAG TPA: helix-turn-helix domain-containing protein [Vicingaceae bacterium]
MRKNKLRELIFNHPTYWVEGVNGDLYDTIISYMKKHNMKRKDLAIHLNISPGRVSQILNNGDINFSLEKVIEIALKLDKVPVFKFENKEEFLEKEKMISNVKEIFINYNINQLSDLKNVIEKPKEAKVISITAQNNISHDFVGTNQLLYCK